MKQLLTAIMILLVWHAGAQTKVTLLSDGSGYVTSVNGYIGRATRDTAGHERFRHARLDSSSKRLVIDSIYKFKATLRYDHGDYISKPFPGWAYFRPSKHEQTGNISWQPVQKYRYKNGTPMRADSCRLIVAEVGRHSIPD